MTPEEIVAEFAHALDNFNPITGKLSNTDLTRLREAVAPLLLNIMYGKTGGKHNLIGIIWTKLAYIARYGEAFPEPKRVGSYNLNIDDDDTAVIRARLEDVGIVGPDPLGLGERLAVAGNVATLCPNKADEIVFSTRFVIWDL